MVKRGTKKPRQLAKTDRFPLIEKALGKRTKAELMQIIVMLAKEQAVVARELEAWLGVEKPVDLLVADVSSAIDRATNFDERQSTRADVSRWSFSVEYHYSSFRGDVDGLLRRGYDVFLQHTNYGVREIRLRLPHGMPFPKSTWSKYVDGDELTWKKDTKGNGGILSLHPCHESDELEEVWETKVYLDASTHVRERLINGDLRALYLLWLCAAYDDYTDPDEIVEPPVPHGISDMATRCGELMLFFGLDPLMLRVAGKGVEAASIDRSKDQPVAEWIKSLDNQRASDLLFGLLTDDTAGMKARALSEVRDSQSPSHWPTTDKRRSLAELARQTEDLRSDENAKTARKAEAKAKCEAAKAKRRRAERMKEMVKDPIGVVDHGTKVTARQKSARSLTRFCREISRFLTAGHTAGRNSADSFSRPLSSSDIERHSTQNQRHAPPSCCGYAGGLPLENVPHHLPRLQFAASQAT